MPHHQFLPFADSDSNLDLATAAILDAAYDRALAELHDRGPDSVRQAIARRIVTLVAAGGRDPDRLCDQALVPGGFLPHRRDSEPRQENSQPLLSAPAAEPLMICAGR